MLRRLVVRLDISVTSDKYCTMCFFNPMYAIAQTFLDRGDATARILAVVKGFEKVSRLLRRLL